MEKLPQQLVELIMKQPGTVGRRDTKEVLNQLQKLGIREDCQFAIFFLHFSPINFRSSVSYEQINDIASPTPQIAEATEFIQEVWELPSDYICLTTTEGEGCYLYSKESEAVFNFDLGNREDFLASRPDPIAPNFYNFLIWYLSGDVSNQES